MSTMEDRNAGTIDEFRGNHGQVGGYFAGAPLLLLHAIGARSGSERINPTMYLRDGDRYVVLRLKAGADTNPDRYHNLKADPDVQIEVGDQTLDVHAEEVYGTERDVLFERQAERYPGFAGYQRQTSRIIPVVALTAMPQ